MKQQHVKGFLAVCALTGMVIFGGCKNDPSPDTSEVQSSDVQGNIEQPIPKTEDATAFRTTESTIKAAQELLMKHSEMRDLMSGLREQTLKVPAEVKRNVVDYPQLEATLEGYSEKGENRLDELYQVLNQAQKDLEAGNTPSNGKKQKEERLGYAEIDQILLEQTRALNELKVEYEKLKAAVDKLEKAPNNGKGLRLYE